MTRPWRRMILHLLQIFLTLGLTFTANFPSYLLVPVDDASAAQVVRTELNDHPVVRQDTDVVHPHLPTDVSEYLVPVVQLHSEEGVGQRLDHRAFDLDGAVFLGHILRASSCVVVIGIAAVCGSPGENHRAKHDVLPGGTRDAELHMTRRKASRWAAAESTAPLPRTRTGSITPRPRALFHGTRIRGSGLAETASAHGQ